MNESDAIGIEPKNVEQLIGIVKSAKRKQRAALSRIKRAERFLAKLIDGLGYDSRHIYAADTFTYPPTTVVYNGGMSRILESDYILSFAKDDRGWHFFYSPTTSTAGEGATIHSDEATRLIDAPAGVVLCCAERIDVDLVNILDQVASLVSSSYCNISSTAQNGRSAKKAQSDA